MSSRNHFKATKFGRLLQGNAPRCTVTLLPVTHCDTDARTTANAGGSSLTKSNFENRQFNRKKLLFFVYFFRSKPLQTDHHLWPALLVSNESFCQSVLNGHDSLSILCVCHLIALSKAGFVSAAIHARRSRVLA